MNDFKEYIRIQVAEIREVTVADIYRFANYGKIEYSWSGIISISQADLDNGSPKIGDMIGRNPKNHKDQWLIAEQYFKDNFKQAINESDIYPTNHDVMQACINQLHDSNFDVGFIDPEFIKKFKE